MEYESHSSPKRAQRKHLALRIILRDVILFAVALNVFALFHHVLPRKLKPVDSSRYAIATPAPAQATHIPR
jgi:hypothetical protein